VNNLIKQNPTASILITGHSLGAALATMAAIDIKNKIKIAASKITFYTFGSPRVGNQAMANYIFHLYPNGAYQRVTHYNDIVPHVPPREVFGNIHSGNEVWYPH
jgi:predicted lipase